MKKLKIEISKDDDYYFVELKNPILFAANKNLKKAIKSVLKQLKDLQKDLNEDDKLTDEWFTIRCFLNDFFN